MCVVSAFSQNDPVKPRAVLVGVISGKSAGYSTPTRSTTSSNNSVGSANDTEARAWELMNARRQVTGLTSLEWDERLVSLARMHSESMANGGYFSHKDLNGGYVDDRASKLGIFNWLSIGENIAFMKGYSDPATMAVEKWMQSPSHKKNILNSQWRDSAIGTAVAADGAIYFTQVFIY